VSTRKPRPSANQWTLALPSRSATESFGKSIGRSLEAGAVLALVGELGAGKTTLVRGIAAGLGLPASVVSSPTFVLIHQYKDRGRLPLVHMDLYRLRHASEALAIGLPEQFTDRSAVVVEWADRFPALLPDDRLEIELAHRSPATRSARLCASGPRSMALLSRLRKTRRSPRASAGSRRATARTRATGGVRA
jgi:tRNA threonylcarbamoyladenosine biosynthesis protein TsaE